MDATTKLRNAVDKVASMRTVIWLAESSKLQQLVFSTEAQKAQQLAYTLHRRIAVKPIRLAEHYVTVLATMAIPPNRTHDISIVGIASKGRFHLLRRHPDDEYEAGALDNVAGHADRGEDHSQTARREIMEETRLPIDDMLASKDARLHDMGHFGWLMHLRTPNGLKPSLLYGKMFILDAPDIEAHHIRLKSDEHTEVVTMRIPEITRRMAEICVFDRLFFNANLSKLDRIHLRQ